MSNVKPIEELFQELIELPSAEERQSFLDRVCGEDAGLRQKLEGLVHSHEQAGSFLQEESLEETRDIGLKLTSGQTIGPYKLRELIGEGGMGSVYVAQQEMPVKRKVALKVIKPGMDTKEVVARFEAERQALAMMNHRGIAKVFDAGMSEHGRPYFVMELINGVPITQYCDDNKLGIRQRLELFVQVCKAVQHAHQKGVIHRDIKPSNVMVTLHDGEPVPVIIDFGVAKATHQSLTEQTIYTRLNQVVGTTLYMSPEQAELSRYGVDTRTDVYSLGVLLYELLTGLTPFDRERLNTAAFDEVRRIIREEEPPKPSTRISSLGNTATDVSGQRNTEPAKLTSTIRGDLDWIVMKALEKDRNRRYESATSFSDDVENYLSDQVVTASPPSATYRVGRFARRNRGPLALGACVIAAITIWMASLGISNTRLESALGQLANSAYEQAIMAALLDDTSSAERALVVAEKAGISQIDRNVIQALLAINRTNFDEAATLANETLRSNPDHPSGLAILTQARLWQGYTDDYETGCERLSKLRPRRGVHEDVDRLLMAHALQLARPHQSGEMLNESPRMKHSPVGLLLLANTATWEAKERQDAELALHALRDYEYLRFLLPNNEGILNSESQCMAAAIQLTDDDDVYRSLVARGSELAEQLKATEGNVFRAYSLSLLLRALGQKLEASETISQFADDGFNSLHFVSDCVRTTRTNGDAFDAFRKRIQKDADDKYIRIAQCYVVHDASGGQQQVRQLVSAIAANPDEQFLSRLFALQALCLAGNLPEVTQLAKQIDAGSRIDRFGNNVSLRYLQDPNEENARQLELLSPKNGYGNSQLFFTAGLAELAKGNRQSALLYFEKCHEHQHHGNLCWELGNAMYYRMSSIDDWPQWTVK